MDTIRIDWIIIVTGILFGLFFPPWLAHRRQQREKSHLYNIPIRRRGVLLDEDKDEGK